MAKKRKKKKIEGFDSEKWQKYQLKQMKEGESFLDKQGKWRSRKYRIPKWLSKHDSLYKSIHMDIRKKLGRWANNEERILVSMFSFSDYKIQNLSKMSKIDYKNISRYLKPMEKKGLIKIKDDYRYEKQKSGKYKQYHLKEVSLAEKGRDKKKELLGYWV